ncbi:MarR family winged helix-turn-helix transcriptional regulator [Catenuloplanes sp. NPDC051500]|uniref:MarR family winged helix-turn-helix transcriptional regulator n=1 Tax=Catenuloplanes sp. NPDC051500 TaxID=3363959 RepID=UPI0037BB3C85
MNSRLEISDTLGRLHQVLRRAAARRNGAGLLPDAQIAVLRLVEGRPGIRVRDVAEALRAAPNTVSTLVGDLANAGLLARERAPENRRQVRLTLTGQARDRIDAYHAQRREVVADALDRLGPEARDRITAALPDLHRLAELIDAGPERETPAGPERETPAGPERETPAGPERETPAGPERETPAGPERETSAGREEGETPAGPEHGTPRPPRETGNGS